MAHLERPLEDRGGTEHDHHDRSAVLPLAQLLEYPHQVDAREQVTPAVTLVRGRGTRTLRPPSHHGGVHPPFPRGVEDAVGEVHDGIVVP